MLLQFDANQEYQIRAIESVIALLAGQPRVEVELQFASTAGFAAIGNRLDLDDDALIKNLQSVQAENNLPHDAALQFIEAEIETIDGKKPVRFCNFSIEMETGTGKTYIYIRTTLELFRGYGLRKFIIVVPSIAIREGVLKTLEITEKHLRELYGNLPYRFYAYDSDNLSQLRQFALSDGVELMVMTIDSFNKASNVIRQTTDRLQGETPIHLVQAARPILILDEPQNMESELRVRALAALDPLFALRYSATHRNPYNLVYRLTPFEAYRQGLVKRIEVAGIEKEGDANQVFLRLDHIKSEKKTLSARIALHKLMAGGAVKEQVVTVKMDDALEGKANRPEYAPFIVAEINAGDGFVRFANGVELRVGEARGADKDAIFAEQIRYTIDEHFRRQARLRDAGIKVLSLFFIDRVDNYVLADGIIRQLFNRTFAQLKTKYPEWREADAAKVQAAYFAARKTKSGEVIYEDSKTGESEKDKEAYSLIMRDKERLLSFDEPTCFIFSHSALREGWDSPNVFQICTLNQTASEMKKRQEIGRGVRLAVNQQGERVRDEKVNVLTVVANASYENYVARYQEEIEEEFGREGLPPKPANARQRGVARLRKEFTLKPEFKELWERIKHKTRYAVKIDSEKLIADVARELDQTEIHPPRLRVDRARLDVEGEQFTATRLAERRASYEPAARTLPNIVEIIANLMERTTPPVRITRQTLLKIFKRTRLPSSALANPHEFATTAAQIIKRKLAEQMLDGIQYEKIGAWYEMTQFEAEIESWKEYLVPADRSLYDHVKFDSDIEKQFVVGLENRDDVKLYLKLPNWFTVDTPIGTYNPDWAIVFEPRDEHGKPTGEQMLYLVRETKGTTDLGKLHPDEARKIRCGERHFQDALGVNYKVVTNARDIF